MLHPQLDRPVIDLADFVEGLKSEISQLVDNYSHLPKTLKYKIADKILYASFDSISIYTFFYLADDIADNDPNIAKLIRESVIELTIDMDYLQRPEVTDAIGLRVARDEKYLRERAAQLFPNPEENSEYPYSPVVIMAGGIHLFTGLPDSAEIYEFESSVTSGTKINNEAILNDANTVKLFEAVANRHEKRILIIDDVMDSGTTFLAVVDALMKMIVLLNEQGTASNHAKSVINLVSKVRNAIKLVRSKSIRDTRELEEQIPANLKMIRELLTNDNLNVFSFFAADKITRCYDDEATHALACFGNEQSPPWLMGWGMDTEIHINATSGDVSFDMSICVGRWLRDIVALDISSGHLPEPCTNLSGSERLALVVQAILQEKLGMPDCVVTLANEA